MPFTELCIYQVKPQKTEEFEALMLEAKSFLEEQEGMLFLRLIKRGYHIDMEQIKRCIAENTDCGYKYETQNNVSCRFLLFWSFICHKCSPCLQNFPHSYKTACAVSLIILQSFSFFHEKGMKKL